MMGDRYTFSDTSHPPEGWPSSFDQREVPLLEAQGEAVYEAARDVLLDAGVPYPRAVHLAEAVRKRALGL